MHRDSQSLKQTAAAVFASLLGTFGANQHQLLHTDGCCLCWGLWDRNKSNNLTQRNEGRGPHTAD